MFVLRSAVAAGVGIAVALVDARLACAQQPHAGCEVHLIPPDPPPFWRSSVGEVASRVRGSADCRELQISMTETEASLVFVSRDDRRAVRAVDTPAALAAVVDALLVTLPVAIAGLPEAPVEPPTLTAAPVVAGDVSASPAGADGPKQAPTTEARALVIHASAGGRLGFPASYVSPTLGLAVGVSSVWDFWLTGQWDALSTRAGLPADFRRTAIFAGGGAGRRVPVGDVAVLVGVVGGVSFDSERFTTTTTAGNAGLGSTSGNGQQGPDGQQATAGDGQPSGVSSTTPAQPSAASVSHSTSRVEPRTGIYFGVAFPRRSRLRFRPTLTADVVPSRLGRELSIDPSVPAIPWWSLGLTIGMEGAIP